MVNTLLDEVSLLLYSREMLPPPNPAHEELFQSRLKPVREPLARHTPLPSTRPVTAKDIESFESDPFEIVGMVFILHSTEDGDGGILYEVAEIGSSKAKGMWYQVQFEGCVDYIEVDGKEMMRMLRDSILVT